MSAVRIVKYCIVSLAILTSAVHAKYSTPTGLDTVMLVDAPTPSMSLDSVKEALRRFSIELPRNVEIPEIDAESGERGTASKRAFSEYCKVVLGPSAFESWAILGSTLAHEIEVHCKQNYFIIGLKDMLGLSGTEVAEKAAYQHELDNAKRFGLSQRDIALIKGTMDLYYGESE